MSVRVGVFGAGGAMGREVMRAVLAAEADGAGVELVGAFARAGSAHIGRDAGALAGVGECGVAVAAAERLGAEDLQLDAVIDFSAPAGTLQCARLCAARGIALATGVTGFTDEERAAVAAAGEKVAVVMAANMSAGIHAMAELIARAAALLRAGALGGGFDLEIFEAHHRRKKDAPSGTALQLGEILAAATGADFRECAVFGRHGRDEARQAGDIGFSVLRGGDIAGEHRVVFAAEGEVLEVIHRAGARGAFARGAVRAARFAARADKGVYGMREVLTEGDF